jgi:hypothetical protein
MDNKNWLELVEKSIDDVNTYESGYESIQTKNSFWSGFFKGLIVTRYFSDIFKKNYETMRSFYIQRQVLLSTYKSIKNIVNDETLSEKEKIEKIKIYF